jgi:hypothetical protein
MFMVKSLSKYLAVVLCFSPLLSGCKPPTPQISKPTTGSEASKPTFPTTTLSPLKTGQAEGPASRSLNFVGWHDNEGDFLRWSKGKSCSLEFAMDPSGSSAKRLILSGYMNGPQRVSLSLNGRQIYSGQVLGSSQTLTIDLPSGAVTSGTNSLVFDLPDARPGNGDTRIMALGFQALKLE